MRVVVTGGRSYFDVLQIYTTLERLLADNPNLEVAAGDASGVDAMAGQWCFIHNIPFQKFKADWSYGPSGGPRRNRKMLETFQPVLVVAFPGGRGTANCVYEAEKRGIEVLRITNDNSLRSSQHKPTSGVPD